VTSFVFVSLVSFVLTAACRERQASPPPSTFNSAYLDYSSRDDRMTGGVRLIPKYDTMDPAHMEKM